MLLIGFVASWLFVVHWGCRTMLLIGFVASCGLWFIGVVAQCCLLGYAANYAGSVAYWVYVTISSFLISELSNLTRESRAML